MPYLRWTLIGMCVWSALIAGTLAAGGTLPSERLWIDTGAVEGARYWQIDIMRGLYAPAAPEFAAPNDGVLSPDGTRVAYRPTTGSLDIYTRASGTTLALTAQSPTAYRFTSPFVWSPDGRQIAFSALQEGGGDLFIIDADTPNSERPIARTFQDETTPVWSPDGRWIAFASNRQTPLDPFLPLYLYDTTVERTRRLTHTGIQYYGYVWSADSQSLIAWEYDPEQTRFGRTRIYTPPLLVALDIGTGRRTPLLISESYSNSPPSATVDGRVALAMNFIAPRGAILVVVDAGGTVMARVSTPFTVGRIAWQGVEGR